MEGQNTSLGLPDLSKLMELSGGDSEFMIEILELFLQEEPEVMKSMQEKLSVGDFDTLKGIAHKFKSSTKLIANKQFIHIIEQIETEAGNKNKSVLDPLVSEISVHSKELVKNLTLQLNELKNQ